jgi:DNA topoisomerase VI subunit B
VSQFANFEPAGGFYLDKTPSRPVQLLQSDLEFTRHDWSLYISNLPQRAGVPLRLIRALVLKELVDNALDEMDRAGPPGAVTLTQECDHTYTVTDRGRGFCDTPEQLAHRFSLAKGMVSSKQWRKPTRGCVGNGLRVVVGAVVSGGGRIIVRTRNQAVTLRPRLDGTTAVDRVVPIDWPIGAAVTIEIDPNYPLCESTLDWAQTAITLAQQSGPAFSRKPMPAWYDADHLALNMLAAIGAEATVAWFVGQLDRSTSREIGQLVTAKFGKGRLCRDMSKADAAELLWLLQCHTKTLFKPKRLGPMGARAWEHAGLTDGYACEEGSFTVGRVAPYATIPFLVEAWAATCKPSNDIKAGRDLYPVDIIGCTINRSPAIINLHSYRDGVSRSASLTVGSEYVGLDVPKGAFAFSVSITSPYIPILGDNKTPHLGAFTKAIKASIEAAIRRSARRNPPILFTKKDGPKQEERSEKSERIFQRDAILHVLPEAIERSSEGGYSFSLRSLYYRVRILTKAFISAEPTYNYFSAVITDYEADCGEIEKLIRDTRGVYVQPHGGELTPMGTITVSAYVRPAWSYSNILFLEKEDLVSALRQSGFLDRWDCFAMSSKGFSSRAARDLIDKIGASGKDEPTKFFTVHDADASGSLISQTLVNATKARAARNVKVIDLGFFPWTALAEGLLREPVERKSTRRRPVADYIKERDAANRASGNPNHEPNWEIWLQDWRVELNAMTTAEFVTWMNAQF